MKIVFFIHSIQVQRCIKRIEDFINHGFEVDVYGFDRKIDIHSVSKLYTIKIIGTFRNTDSYISRMSMMYKAIVNTKKKYKNQNVLYYYFGFDVGLLGTSFSLASKNYFFEESDLIHTKFRFNFLNSFLELIDKRIIQKSFETIFTSEGFEKFHFGDNKLDNVTIIPNRVNKRILQCDKIEKQSFDINHLKFGLVGGARYRSAVVFASVVAEFFPQHEFHFFGYVTRFIDEFDKLKKFQNIYFHGVFANPDDLYKVYSQVDLVIATYDATSLNVRFAEPNKLYDSIYFETPIIVSKDTFLSSKVDKLGIGFCVNALNQKELKSFIQKLKKKSIEEKIENIRKIPKDYALDINEEFFTKIWRRLIK